LSLSPTEVNLKQIKNYYLLKAIKRLEAKRAEKAVRKPRKKVWKKRRRAVTEEALETTYPLGARLKKIQDNG
jgi:hypothetical protein